MKKYILFQVMLCLGVTFYACGMESCNPWEPDKSGICYLNTLPLEILDFIARFLMCDDETDQEFIERTLREKEEEERELIVQSCNEVRRLKIRVEQDNIDKTATIVLAQKDYYYDGEAFLGEVWLYDRAIEKCYFYEDKLEKNSTDMDCCGLALSPRGTMFAFCHYKDSSDEQLGRMVLEVIKIDREEKQGGRDYSDGVLIVQKRRELDCGIFPNYLAFNKQGNALIAYTGHFDHKIFPLKVIDQNEPPVIIKGSNKLQDYLRDKFVCDTYIEGKK